MEGKRTKVNCRIEELPLDCWGEILTFLSSYNDFMSLVLTVKGFFEYIKNIRPITTENIEFHFQTPPWKSIRHVTFVKFERKSLVHHQFYNLIVNDKPILNKARCVSFESLFELLGGKFPNLKTLKLNYFSESEICDDFEDSSDEFKMKISSKSSEATNLLITLNKLRIIYPGEVKIEQEMKNVNEFYLSNGMDFPYSISRGTKLILSDECLPKCSRLTVIGFEIKGFEKNENLQNRLKCLILQSNSRIDSLKICLKNLVNLSMFQINDGMDPKMKLGNIPSLKSFEHSLEEVFDDYEDSRSCDTNFFGSHPLIESIIFMEDFDLELEEDESNVYKPLSRIKLLVYNYHQLTKLQIRSPQNVIVSGCPSLVEVKIESFFAEIHDINSMKNLKTFDCRTNYGSEFIPSSQKIENLSKLQSFVSSSKSRSVSFLNNSRLEYLTFDRIGGIGGCDSLKSLELQVRDDSANTFALPSKLENVIITLSKEIDDSMNDDRILENVVRILSLLSNCEVGKLKVDFGISFLDRMDRDPFKFRGIQASELSLDYCGNVSIFENLNTSPPQIGDQFSFLSEIRISGEGNVSVIGFPLLRKFTWHCGFGLGIRSYSIEVKDCPILSKIELKNFSSRLKGNSLERLMLSNIPHLETLYFGNYFTGIRNLVIRNAPLTKLHLTIYEKCTKFNNDEGVSIFNIERENFPKLQRLILRTKHTVTNLSTSISSEEFFKHFKMDEDKRFRINVLEFIPTLEVIKFENVDCQRAKFARDIRMDFLLKIMKYRRLKFVKGSNRKVLQVGKVGQLETIFKYYSTIVKLYKLSKKRVKEKRKM